MCNGPITSPNSPITAADGDGAIGEQRVRERVKGREKQGDGGREDNERISRAKRDASKIQHSHGYMRVHLLTRCKL